VSAPDPFQARVARIALHASRDHGFALAGGHGLIAHGVIARPTLDIDLFTDRDGAVQAAARLVVAALTAAGLDVVEVEDTSGLADLFDGFEQDMVELMVSDATQTVELQLVRFDRGNHPVIMEIGPVLHLHDLVGTKGRGPRDQGGRARLPGRRVRARPVHARPTDRPCPPRGRRPDRRGLRRGHAAPRPAPDEVFRVYQQTPEQIRELRQRFAPWPRAADHDAD
jgi:hypothetical protein